MLPLEASSSELQRLHEGDFLELEVLEGNVLSDQLVKYKCTMT